MNYQVVVTIRRGHPGTSSNVTDVIVTRHIRAPSWGKAANLATDSILDDLSRLLGGLPGVSVTSVAMEALP